MPGLTGVVSVTTDENSAYAVKSDGTVWAWGYNWHGKLGDETTTDRSAPIQVAELLGITSIIVAGSTAYALADTNFPTLIDRSDNLGFARQELGEPNLVHAAANGQVDIVESLLAQGGDPNADADGVTALLEAASNGHISVVNLLLVAPGRPGIWLVRAALHWSQP